MLKRILFIFLILFIVGCATTQHSTDAFWKATMLYDMTARTLARTCVIYDVPKETCDRWGFQLERIRLTLKTLGEFWLYSLDEQVPDDCIDKTSKCTNQACIDDMLRLCYEQRFREAALRLERAMTSLRLLLKEASNYARKKE